MIALILKKVISISLIAASMLNPIGTKLGVNAGWEHDNNGWLYKEVTQHATEWKNIDGNWYYFYKENDSYGQTGYMAHDTIIDGRYLNHNGLWSDGGKEIQAYDDLLKDTNWLKDNGIIYRNGTNDTISSVIVIDINQDGVYEMLVYTWKFLYVITYNNGNIKKIEDIHAADGGYSGYSSSKKIFFVRAGRMGHYWTDGYKLENDECKKIFSSTDDEIISNTDEDSVLVRHDYTINGQKVSTTEYEKYFKKFGTIEK